MKSKSVNSFPRRRQKRATKSVLRFRLPVIIEKDADGYFAVCPSLQGCYTQGNTYEEALKNIQEAVCLHIEDRLESGEPIPDSEEVSFTTLEIEM
jgi:predicted RNase H-like HicB family nuclease